MAKNDPPVSPAMEESLAKQLFNFVWSLLDKSSRTPDEDFAMLHAAHASRHHWGRVGEPVHLARGEWQIARVYAVLGRGEPACVHAQRCLELCEAHDLSTFDHGAAHEALARAAAVAGDWVTARRHLDHGRELAAEIADADDRQILTADLDSVPLSQ